MQNVIHEVCNTQTIVQYYDIDIDTDYGTVVLSGALECMVLYSCDTDCTVLFWSYCSSTLAEKNR